MVNPPITKPIPPVEAANVIPNSLVAAVNKVTPVVAAAIPAPNGTIKPINLARKPIISPIARPNPFNFSGSSDFTNPSADLTASFKPSLIPSPTERNN